ncbi:MAG: hypothetical protein ACOC41_05435 [Chitinivibrionales bacterium]
MHEEDFGSREEKEIDLKLENESLRDEIALRGGFSHKSEQLDPELENAFLKNVMAFEEALDEPEVPIRSFFPSGYEFPPVTSLTDEQITNKLDEIQNILSLHHVEFGFVENLPDRVLYKHMVEEYIPNGSVPPIAIGSWVLDACSGCCEDCFQRPYCSTANDLPEGNL